MSTTPRDTGLDSTRALLSDPYRFISRRCHSHGSDLFETRLLLERTTCVTGPAAVELVYDEHRFARAGATPRRVRATLFGAGGVQGLDGTAHRHRKRLAVATGA